MECNVPRATITHEAAGVAAVVPGVVAGAGVAGGGKTAFPKCGKLG
jgi:hypothetical protein